MYEFDQEYVRQHRQQMARQQAKRERIARDVASASKKNKTVSPLPAGLITVITLLIGR